VQSRWANNKSTVLPGRKHHGEAAEVTAGQSHHYSTETVQVIIAKQHRQSPLVWLKVAEHEEWYKQST